MSCNCPGRLVVDIRTVNTDPVNGRLLVNIPDRLSEIDLVEGDIDRATGPEQEDLARRCRIGLGNVDSNHAREAVTIVSNVRVIDVKWSYLDGMIVHNILWKNNRTVAVNGLGRNQVGVIAYEACPRKCPVHC